MKHYWCFLCVRYQKPKVIRVGDRAEALRAKGYWRRMGVTVRSGADLRSVIKRVCEDGNISWRRSELERIPSYDLGETGVREIWYRGGRVYFTQ